jgi:hypothetical protein
MKITKAQEKRRAELVVALHERGSLVRERFAALLEYLSVAAVPVNEALRSYNEAVKQAEAFAAEVASELREAVEEKSDRWKESDAGQAAESFASEWEEFAARPIPQIHIIDPELEEKPCHALSELPSESDQ